MPHEHSAAIPLLLIVLPALMAVLYSFMWKSMARKKKCAAAASVFILIAALFPLEEMVHGSYPMSHHMWTHMLILLIFPPLFWLAIPLATFNKFFSHPALKKTITLLSQPVLAYCTGMAVMWIVNIPMLMPQHKHIHESNNFLWMSLPVSFGLPLIMQLLAGLIYSLPVFAPLESLRLMPLQRVVYLFISCIGCTLLGILIALNPTHMYTLSDNNLLLSTQIDLQLSGLIMWVPGCIIYITKSILILSEFFKNEKLAESY